MITVQCIFILVSLLRFVHLPPFLCFLSSTLSFSSLSLSLSVSPSLTHTPSPSPLSSTTSPSSSLFLHPSSFHSSPFLPVSSHTRNAPYIPIDTLLFVPFSTGGVNNPNSYQHVHTVHT